MQCLASSKHQQCVVPDMEVHELTVFEGKLLQKSQEMNGGRWQRGVGLPHAGKIDGQPVCRTCYGWQSTTGTRQMPQSQL